MFSSALFVLVASLALVAGSHYDDWAIVSRAPKEAEVTIRFALTQYNMDIIESTLLDVSDPTSPNYGKWWSREQILDVVAPDASVSAHVTKFLLAQGATHVEDMRDSVKCVASVPVVEQLLQIPLYLFQHKIEGKYLIRSDESYMLPEQIVDYVDFVAGVYEFPKLRTEQLNFPTEGVDAYLAPQTIANLYQIPSSYAVNSNSSLCVVQYLNYGGAESRDLQAFANGTALPLINAKHKIGNYTNFYFEGTLDMEYAGSLSMNTSLWVWSQNGWLYDFAVDVQAAAEAPLVISMSWGWPETQQCGRVHNCTNGETAREYVERTNDEYKKIGLRGITILASSGDQGAPGDLNTDCSASGNVFSSIFPGASPWVLSVGATMLQNSTTPSRTGPPVCVTYGCTSSTQEEACTWPKSFITTGGGFSDYAPLPEFQAAAVAGYLKNTDITIPPAKLFNASNRAFPDVSAVGHKFFLHLGGIWSYVDGTSAATPVWAAIISLLNSERLNNNKPPLGFIAPLLYQAYAADPTTFNDIVVGDNKCTEACCDKYGYETAVGWDPVTGLGTPVFPKLLAYVQSLPQ